MCNPYYFNRSRRVSGVVPVLVFFMLGFFAHRGIAVVRQGIVKEDIWTIGIARGTSPLSLNVEGIPNPVLKAEDVSDIKAKFVADPFLVREEGTWYMFFEALDAATGKGKIAYARSQDGLHWQYKQVILSEPFHLSYPYVFKSGRDYYMIPESHEAYAVLLYKAVEFPIVWQPVKRLLSGEFVDSSIFRLNGSWWMFTTDLVDHERGNVLRLFSSPAPEGPWTEHPASPLPLCTMHNSRCGGRVTVIGSQAFRFAQDDSGGAYGNRLRCYKITRLTPTAYREVEVRWPIVRSAQTNGGEAFEEWHSLGMHQADPQLTANGTWLAAIDGHAWRTTYKNRLLAKLAHLFK